MNRYRRLQISLFCLSITGLFLLGACGRNETRSEEVDKYNSPSIQIPLEEIAEKIEYEYVYENMIDHIADYDYKQLSFLPSGKDIAVSFYAVEGNKILFLPEEKANTEVMVNNEPCRLHYSKEAGGYVFYVLVDWRLSENGVPVNSLEGDYYHDFKENLSFSAPVPYSDPVPISISVPVQYEDYMDETAPDTLEDMQMSEIWSRDSAQKKKGITMTSVNNNNDIPAYNSQTGNDYANYIHFHMAGRVSRDNSPNPYSIGCITVPVREYVKIGKQIGFMKEQTDEKIGDDNIYSNAQGKLKDCIKDFDGYMVIDRQYYDDKGNDKGDKYLKFNGPRGQE